MAEQKDQIWHLNYNNWSLNYQYGIEKSLGILEEGESKLDEFQLKFIKGIQKKYVLASYESGRDFLTLNGDITYFDGNLSTLLDDLQLGFQDHFDSKLMTSTLIESDIVIPLANFISAYKSFKQYLDSQLHTSLSLYQSKAKELKKLELEYVKLVNRLNDLKYASGGQLNKYLHHKNGSSTNTVADDSPSTSGGNSVTSSPLDTHRRTASLNIEIMNSFASKLNSNFNSINLSSKINLLRSQDDTKLAKDQPGQGNENKGTNEDEPLAYPIEFPLVIGDDVLTFETVDQLSQFTKHMYNAVPRSVTKILFVSYKLESINAKDLSAWLLKNVFPNRASNHGAVNGEKDFESKILTRAQIEKIGQALLDLKLLSITNLAKKLSKFKSDDGGLWFEYTDLYKYVMNFEPETYELEDEMEEQVIETKEEKKEAEEIEPNEGKEEELVVLEDSSPVKTEIVEKTQTTPSKSLHATQAFKNIASFITASSDFRSTDITTLNNTKEELITKFDSIYEEYLLVRLDLETKLLRVNNDIETKELERVKFIYKMLNRLTDIISSQLNQELKDLQQIYNSVSQRDSPSVHLFDIDAVIKRHSAQALYTINPTLNSLAAKFKALSDLEAPLFGSDLLLQKSSVTSPNEPHFVVEVLQRLEDTPGHWNEPLDFLTLSNLKSRYSQISKEVPSQVESIDKFLGEIQEQEQRGLSSVFKLYLLELSESVIPLFLHENINECLKKVEDASERQRQLLNIIEVNLSRTNLAVLSSLLANVSKLPEEQISQLNDHRTLNKISFIHLIFRNQTSRALDLFVKADVEKFQLLTSDLLVIAKELPLIIAKKEEQRIERQALIKQNRYSGLYETNKGIPNGAVSTGGERHSRHSRHSSYTEAAAGKRDSLKPFTLKEKTRSPSRSPTRKGINLMPAAGITSPDKSVDVLGNIQHRRGDSTITESRENAVEIHIIESSPKKNETN